MSANTTAPQTAPQFIQEDIPSTASRPWEAHPWTTQAATTVTTPDATSITGKRVVAECGTEEDAQRIANLPALSSKVAACADRLNHHRWTHPGDQCMAMTIAAALRDALVLP